MCYYKINDKLKMFFDNRSDEKDFVRGVYSGYIHITDSHKGKDDNVVWGELVVNGKYFKRGWIQKSCVGDEVTKEEWEEAYGDCSKR